MLDLKLIRENPDLIRQKLKARNMSTGTVDSIVQLDVKRREFIGEVEKLKSLRNSVSQEIAKMKKEGSNADEKIADMKKVSDDIKALDDKLAEAENEIDIILRDIPNLADDSVPPGKTSDDNVQFRIWGEKASGDFKYLDHVELGKKLDILDFGVGAKISGSGFPFYKGKGAMLERALIN